MACVQPKYQNHLINVKNKSILELEQVRLFGGAASNAILDPSTLLFKELNIQGFIGYKIQGRCAIVFGDPVCAKEDVEKLCLAFHKYCDREKLNVIYVTASKEFAEWSMKHMTKSLVEFGSEILIDPFHDPRSLTGDNASLVRRKVRHAEKEQTSVHEYIPHDKSIEEAMESVSNEWLKKRDGPQIYISHVRLFEDKIGKRWFYAKQGNSIVGVVQLNLLEAKSGWLLNHLMTTPTAPNGTPELLVVACIDKLREEGCHYLTCGSVPSHDLGEIIGPSRLSCFLSRQIFKIAKKIFKLNGRIKFWEKYDPTKIPSYLLFTSKNIHLHEIWAIMRSMNILEKE